MRSHPFLIQQQQSCLARILGPKTSFLGNQLMTPQKQLHQAFDFDILRSDGHYLLARPWQKHSEGTLHLQTCFVVVMVHLSTWLLVNALGICHVPSKFAFAFGSLTSFPNTTHKLSETVEEARCDRQINWQRRQRSSSSAVYIMIIYWATIFPC